jgi:hypothetical protein
MSLSKYPIGILSSFSFFLKFFLVSVVSWVSRFFKFIRTETLFVIFFNRQKRLTFSFPLSFFFIFFLFFCISICCSFVFYRQNLTLTEKEHHLAHLLYRIQEIDMNQKFLNQVDSEKNNSSQTPSFETHPSIWRLQIERDYSQTFHPLEKVLVENVSYDLDWEQGIHERFLLIEFNLTRTNPKKHFISGELCLSEFPAHSPPSCVWSKKIRYRHLRPTRIKLKEPLSNEEIFELLLRQDKKVYSLAQFFLKRF